MKSAIMELRPTESLASVVRAFVNQLASGEYDAIIDECSKSRLTVNDIREVIRGYGCTFVEPPPEAFRDLDAVAVHHARQPTWSVSVPLWSKEEGRSDLTLELTIIRDVDCWNIELDDLHIL